MRRLAVLSLAVGCNFSNHGGSVVDGQVEGDGPPATTDGATDAPQMTNCTTFSMIVDSCAVGPYGPKLTISTDKIYSTDTHVLADPNGNNGTTPMFFDTMVGGNPITLLVVDGFEILQPNGKLRVTGARAFGVVSKSKIEISGTLDLTAGGAGARTATTCMTSAGQPGANGNDGASGGGGGGYGATGGKGGKGDNNIAQLPGGNGGGIKNLSHTFIGGCPGGKGGNNNGAAGGLGGAGGGAVFLSSGNSIVISGIVNAGGGGGLKGNAVDGGAGGGGSGGMILLESAVVASSGVLAANGGSGGGGAANSAGGDGNPGQPSTASATGGTASGGGSMGGQGGALAQPVGLQPGDANGGGGGGGGGVGYVSIKSAAPSISGFVSPALTTFP